MKLELVKGRKKGDVVFYGLSTCTWCKKTKALLDELGVEYKYIYADLASEEDRKEAREEVKKWKSLVHFPLIVIDNKKMIPKYDEEEIRKELG